MNFLFKSYQGNVKKMSCKDTAYLRQQLLSVNGIGPETADSILLYALNKPVFVVDAYTKRILLRHHLIKEEPVMTKCKIYLCKILNGRKII